MSRPPNILFLMTDEHRFDFSGFYGHPVVRTPNLDSLAESAVIFDNAYCPSPICIPGRQCMMSGQLPKTCGALQYGDDLQPNSMTFARRFAQFGYHTVACGKLHHMGTDQMQGWTRRIAGDTHVETRYIDDKNDESFKTNRPPKNLKWTDAKEIHRAGVGRARHIAADELTLHGALNFINDYFVDPYYDRATPDEPLLLKVSLVQPHYPYITADEDRFMYYLNRVEPFLNESVFDHPFLSKRSVVVGKDVTELDIRRATAAYCAMIGTADEMFGSVVDALSDAGQDIDNWIIIYTSDHGEMLGQHGIWEKQKFFEASARVPLFIRWPKRYDPRRVSQNVNHCDLFETLCDLAAIPSVDGLDSRCMSGIMSGDASGWNDESISHFGKENLMIKRGSLKYQSYGNAMPEVLFNLAADPGETVNAIGISQHQDAVAAFRKRRAELGY